MTPHLRASLPMFAPPAWAVLERALFDQLERAARVYLHKYTHRDGPRKGELIWRDELPGRDGADDFYEAFYNFPLLYLLGGSDDLLEIAHEEWDAITRQMTRLGQIHKEYERGYDQFHQAESYIYFYLLCLADPTNAKLIDRARRFAGFFLNEDPEAQNYDPEHNILRAPHNGSAGPRWGMNDDGSPVSYGYSPGMAVYGLPYHNVPGITSVEDIKDPVNARRMGEAMEKGMSRGDVANNLGVAPLIANAWLLTHDDKYKTWLLRYVDGWIARARANGGLVPDNVGLSGQVGEYVDGKWYGGLYGWTWPHGFYNLQYAAICAAQCCALLTNDTQYFEFPRAQHDHIAALGRMQNMRAMQPQMSLWMHWVGVAAAVCGPADDLPKPIDGAAQPGNGETYLVPTRFGDIGWFDWQPITPLTCAALWAMSLSNDDAARIDFVRLRSNYDWNAVYPFRSKEDGGHEAPWLEFLAGRNSSYPERALRAAMGQVIWHLDRIREDHADPREVYIHHWQERNPVTTEALIQLTLGAPQIVYNGGLLVAPLRYFDAERERPGLPPDVAALVTSVSDESIALTLVNLSPDAERRVRLQAGAFGEHAFTTARFTASTPGSGYPDAGANYTYAASPYSQPDPQLRWDGIAVDGAHLQVDLPPGTQIELVIGMRRYVNRAGY